MRRLLYDGAGARADFTASLLGLLPIDCSILSGLLSEDNYINTWSTLADFMNYPIFLANDRRASVAILCCPTNLTDNTSPIMATAGSVYATK